MEEIWKLIELLNEYEKEVKKSEFYEWEKWIWWDTNLFRRDTRDEEWSHLYSDTADTYVISKKYGFIWWLVENDKIDFEWMSWHADIIKYLRDVKKYNRNQIKEWVVIMLLAIQDEPIDFLCSILK